ncbi:TonB-dependent receptor plug domain-containing protein [Pelagicoccus mobilis]|uniref:TonB-dependent receptor n=1 Tax=Pelagicoccus mobilis TaxID=415221 RepID=A0A934RWN3_9BACT|nr:TonB-dependent receptor [Pelagicoccus mobilis]MBK1879115.1 TonB-dependent receptor [Pelagicoccus mobilis]
MLVGRTVIYGGALYVRRLFAVYISLVGGSFCLAASDAQDLFDLSFEELLNVKITTGSLTDFVAKHSPSAITTIQREQIELSAARNIAGVLEEHVPGMMLMTHTAGDKIGIRGLIAAENYKLLLLVNGVNVTNNVYEGAMMELDQWELGDIERIEVVRGPGSVTYGSGAIAGVINIITKSAREVSGVSEWSVSYVPEYHGKGFSFQAAKQLGSWSSYFFGSVRESDGLQNPDYFQLRPDAASDIRYVGKRPTDVKGPQPYLGDTLDEPQVKLHLDLDDGRNFRVWARYTESGQSHTFTTYSAFSDKDGNLVSDTPTRKRSIRNFVVSPEYESELNDKWGLTLRASLDAQEYIRYDFRNVDWPEDHPNNIRDYAFSQERLVASALFDYDDGESLKVATGFEYNRTGVHAPWGKNSDHIWVREGLHLVSDADTSIYLQYPDASRRPSLDALEEVGGGLDFDTFTQLSEVTYDLRTGARIVYAHRLDFPEISDTMFAPRLSWIADFSEESTLRISAQRSLRMMPLRAQYLFDKYDRSESMSGRDHESLDSLEVAFTKLVSDSFLLDVNAFYNDSDTVGYTGQDLQFLGDLQLWGVELQGRFQWGNTELIVNHSYIDLLDMAMNPELKTGENRNNISFSDYFYYTGGDVPILLESYGSGLNNWSNNSTRLIVTSKFLDDRLIVRLSARMNWDYEGSYDEIEMYQRAYDTFDTSSLDADDLVAFERQRTEFERERGFLDAEDAYQSDVHFNASLSYRWDLKQSSELVASLFVENLFGEEKRYHVSTGSSNYYPSRPVFVEEPTSVGLRVSVRYR